MRTEEGQGKDQATAAWYAAVSSTVVVEFVTVYGDSQAGIHSALSTVESNTGAALFSLMGVNFKFQCSSALSMKY